MKRALLPALLGLGLFGCDGCGGCGGQDPVAELVAIESSVDRDFARSVKQWQAAAKGDVFNVGDGLRTGDGASAELRLFPDGRMLVQQNAVIRFVDTPPGDKAQRLSIEGGEVEIESGGIELAIDTAFGLTRLKRGSRLRVRGRGDNQSLRLSVGAADIISSDGETRSISAGQGLRLEGGLAVIEIEQPAAEPEPEPEPEPVDAGIPEAEIEQAAAEAAAADVKAFGRFDEPAGTPMLHLVAGESVTIHDPRTPTDVRISLEVCPGGGVVELSRNRGRYKYYRARGEGSAVIRAQAGRYRYRVRCIEDGKLKRRAAKQGRLRIVRDGARRKLPRKPPSVTIDADGRRYSVRYSNMLPVLTFRWRRPPKGSQTLTLKIKGQGTQRIAATSAGVKFKSGQVPEGTHTFFFEAGGTRSKTGTLDVIFDSTARTAYVSAPLDGEAVPGQKVRITGGVLPRSKVSLDGVAVPVTSQGRFAVDVVAPTDRAAIAIRVQHRSAGIHYYLRHLKQ